MIALLPARHSSRWLRVVEHGLGWLTRRQWRAVVLVGMLAFGGSAMLSLVGHIPEPRILDEFSYLLAADTFAHGRLSNPTHPLWMHFESFHIVQKPTYASKYPPAQGLILAAGQVIGGHPIIGVWLSIGLACAAICWLLFTWLPPRWAVLGGLLVVLHPGMLLDWGQSYWGGAVAVIGGALVFGALRRIVRWPRVRDTLWLGVGLAVLANSRPYEGLVMSLPVVGLLIAWMVGKRGPTAQVSLTRIVLPLFLVLALTGGAMGFYNWRVTGEVLRMPYQVHEVTYAVAPAFLWQHPRPEPIYRHKVLQERHAIDLDSYREARSALLKNMGWRVKSLWMFYLGLTREMNDHWMSGLKESDHRLHYLPLLCMASLGLLLWAVRDRWSRFAMLTCGVLTAGLLMESWFHPHYAAPMTGLIFMLMLQVIRHLRLWRWRGQRIGQFMVWTIVMTYAVLCVVAFAQQMRLNRSSDRLPQARIRAQLQKAGGYHLVIVRYAPRYISSYDWVYNEADIDGAKVVWAREMDRSQNRTLLEYFKDRHVWLVEVGWNEAPPGLVPYPKRSRRPCCE
jgi:hypothetical protein